VRRNLALTFFLAVVFIAGVALPAQQANQTRTQPGAARPIRYVIILSVDGLMPATYMQPDRCGLRVPTLRTMVRNGAWSSGARSVLPSLTYPAHTSIATGVNPARHGIVSNEAFDPLDKNDDGWHWYAEDIRVPTLWDLARQQGLRTALVWWPVTVGAKGTAVVPEIWRAGTAEDRKLVRALSTPGVLEAVQKRFPDFEKGFDPPRTRDTTVADIAVHLIETVRPNLLMLHIFDVDHEEHQKGPFSAEACEAIEGADAQIARLIEAAKKAGTWQQTALVVVSDHGFAMAPQQVRPGILLREKGLITLDEKNKITDWKAAVHSLSGSAYVYVKDPNDSQTKAVLLETLRPLAGKEGSGIARVLTAEDIQKMGGDPQAFLWLEAAPGFRVANGYRGDYASQASTVATHGFDPARADMQAALLIYSPALAAGEIGPARLIDVAPTVARWLGLKMEKVEGTPLPVKYRIFAR